MGKKGIIAALGAVFIALSSEYSPVRAADPTPASSSGGNWVNQIKHPAPWLTLSADERIRQEYLPNIYLTNADPPGQDWDSIRIRTRVGAAVAPSDNFTLNTRVTWEPRYWFEPHSREGWNPCEALIDTLNAQLKLPDAGLTLTVGRQDIILGSAWLVLEGTPLDGSRTIYFDAARATLDLKDCKTTVDGIFIYQSAWNDAWLPPIDADERKPQIEQDEIGAILYVTNKSIENTQLDGYFIYKRADKVLANGDDADIYAPGARIIHSFTPNWTGCLEGVYEFGDKNSDNLCAWGLNSRLTYKFNDDHKNSVWIGYEALSGDDPDTSTNEQFDPLWGRWPQWSEGYVYTYANETRIAETTNLQRINVGWQCEPSKKMTLSANYHALFAFQNNRTAGFTDDGKFRGHLITGGVTYKFNQYMSGNLWGELLLPGNYYDDSAGRPFDARRDPAAYLRWEIMFNF
jgi:hypothetical protein